MEISRTELSRLKKFRDNLSKYHDLANQVFSAINGYDYLNQDELTKLRVREKQLRSKLNTDYGAVERIINNLLGGKPFMSVGAVPGARWDVFAEALSSNFTIVKGDSLNYAVDAVNRACGKAESLLTTKPKPPTSTSKKTNGHWFAEDLLAKIKNEKLRLLCQELDNVVPRNPNAGALLMRTILLITLQQKVGSNAKEDLGSVIGQAIAQNVYNDRHITRILKNLSTIPKTILDATHHSKWMLVKEDDLGVWIPGMVKIIEATYPQK